MKPSVLHLEQLPIDTVLASVSSHPEQGLTEEACERSRTTYGSNIFSRPQRSVWLRRIVKQFANPLAGILLFAGCATYLLGHTLDAGIILTALGVNVIIGIFQEGRAGNAFKRLQGSLEQIAVVIRNGQSKIIPSQDLVVGDIVLISFGQRIPADMRILESAGLMVNEALLTGEPEDIVKNVEVTESESAFLPHMLYGGTVVTHGTGKGVVTSVGASTMMGGIVDQLSSAHDVQTPIQKTLQKLSQSILIAVLIIGLIIVVVGALRGYDLYSLVFIGIAVAVSAVPEGLPAAVTVVLALGMERILAQGGLVRNLLAAETLGSTSVILTDKTGTLTEGKMSVDHLVSASDILYPALHERERHEYDEYFVLEIATSASDAFIDEGTGEVVGRPVERAILSKWRTVHQQHRSQIGKQLSTKPFSSAERAAYSLHSFTEEYSIVCASGSPEHLLSQSHHTIKNGSRELLPLDWKHRLEQFQEKETRRGYRLIGTAYALVPTNHINFNDIDLHTLDWIFAGWIVLSDGLRDDVVDAVARAQQAGARVVMVTGDNQGTAQAIAEQAGIMRSDSIKNVVLGSSIEAVSDEALDSIVSETNVFARMTPDAKLKVLSAFQRAGHIVAMTGDGVNDAPALSNAHIGIAVGSGTEVAKESSDLILLDSSFSIIVSAIEEGRRVIDNLRKIVAHMLSTSFSEVMLILSALVIGLPLPLLPAQILWINIAQGGLLNFAFASEPLSPESMKPRHNHAVLTRRITILIGAVSLMNGMIATLLYLGTIGVGFTLEEIRTLFFIVLSLDTILFTFAFKDWHSFIGCISLRNNRFMIIAVVVSLALLSLPFIIPSLGAILSLGEISERIIITALVALIANIVAVEGVKYILFQYPRFKSRM